MKERVPRKKEGKSPSSVQCAFNAITVGSGRHAEPYIIAFHYKSDNVAGKPLGTLFGFFEVEIHDEDAAYIVNFLTSVAKKEYFTNPRREVSDGFETTLHKVNVALAEIAKEGNVSWLGHLHGILGAVSGSTVHFSATGDGVLALVRDNTLRPISDGLAEISSEPHPLKTFTEVSSGKLLDGDVLLTLSPAVWTLFTPEDLKKNLHRLGQAGFEQFLHTALINELPLAGAVIISASEAPLPTPLPQEKPVKEEVSQEKLVNAWSGRAFEQAKSAHLKNTTPTEPVSTPEERKEDYIDKKTGHIYIQGENEARPEENPWQTRVALWSQSFSQGWQVGREKFRRFSRRNRKNLSFFISGTVETLTSSGRRSSRRVRSFFRHVREAREAKQMQAREREETPVSLATPIPTLPSSTFNVKEKLSHFSLPSFPKPNWKLPQLPPGFMTVFLTRSRTLLKKVWETFRCLAQNLWQASMTWWKEQTPQTQRIVMGGAAGVFTLTLGVWFYLDRSTLWDTPEEAAPSLTETPAPLAPASLHQDEPLGVTLTENRSLSSLGGEPIALGFINNLPFDIRSERIINLQTGESSALPEPIRLATAMDDLDALFLVGQSGALYIYTITNKKFEQNSLPLPNGGTIDAIGTYLTYLYVLDRKAGSIYRFPRTEGGFGTPITWSKEPLTLHPVTPLSVFETVAMVLPDGHPTLYSRGRKTEANFTGTKAPLETKSLVIDSKNGDVFALDPKEKRIVRWSATGTLLAQYFHDTFADAGTLQVNTNNELLIARPSGTFAFQLP